MCYCFDWWEARLARRRPTYLHGSQCPPACRAGLSPWTGDYGASRIHRGTRQGKTCRPHDRQDHGTRGRPASHDYEYDHEGMYECPSEVTVWAIVCLCEVAPTPCRSSVLTSQPEKQSCAGRICTCPATFPSVSHGSTRVAGSSQGCSGMDGG